MQFSATYSPDDNKLRLYASGRLSPELYARVKSAGFVWAAKQGLFVAPAWTPEREDLLLELAGEIDDEDTSLLERATERAERFDTYQESRTRDAENAAESVRRIADGIPFGQPILVGHHSERHARRDAEKIETGMRRAVKMWETAQYWEDRAQGAIRHAKYKERPDVRARRIKKLESERRKVAKHVERSEMLVKLWLNPSQLTRKDGTGGELRDKVIWLANVDGSYYSSAYTRPSGYTGPLTLWEAAGGSDHANAIATPEQVREKAIANHTHYLERAARWLAHYDNRLAYERAMLADAGGTAADKAGPEVGGGCKCWASPREGWSYIVKVNKVTVTVLDNWGNGGNHFTRTIPFDKLSAIMSRADVDAARQDGRLIDREPDSTGKVDGFVLRDVAPVPELEPAAPAERPAIADDVQAMRATLRAGGVSVAVVPDLFPTPAELARRMVELADIEPGNRVLEPSAGTGNLVRAIFDAAPVQVVAVERDARVLDATRRQWTSWGNSRVDWRSADFLECNGDLGTFDRIIMNPPFTNAADIRHIMHARHMLRPGGRLVALCANGPRQRDALQAIADTWEDLPEGSFAAAGTGVRVALLTIESEEG